MNTYELINPSDAVSFLAPDDKTAIAVALVLAQGTYGVRNVNSTKLIMGIYLFADQNFKHFLKDNFRSPDGLVEYLNENHKEAYAALRSFAYGSPAMRVELQKKWDATKFPQAALDLHNSKERSSLNNIVGKANSLADALNKKHNIE